MSAAAPERMDPKRLYEKAKKGDLTAGRKLIDLCRVGALQPYWERPRKPSQITDEELDMFIERRRKATFG